MKVLFLTNIPSPYRVDFFNELGKYCNLTVLYELSNATDRNEKWSGGEAFNFKEIFLKGVRIGTESAICFSIFKYLNKDYDVIVIGGYSTPTGMLAIQYLNLKNKSFILSCDGGFIKDDIRIKHIIKKYFIGSAKAWLSTGRNTTEYLLNYGAKKDKIFIYPFTSLKEVDISKKVISNNKKNELRKKLNINEEKVIITVGQFIHRKGIDILIESTKMLPNNYGVYIIGGDPTDEYLDLKKRYNLNNIHFEGFKTKEELKEYYKAADLFVLPTREDIWGLVINEAMAYGLPVITTEKCIAGIELVSNNKNGFIIPIDNEKELYQKIKLILNDSKFKSMSDASLDIISNYTIEKMCKCHIDIFNNIKK